MSKTVIRWGILGCGGIAELFVRSMSSVNDGLIVACAARELRKAQRFASVQNITHAVESYDALAKHPEVDAVYVATTHNAHYKNVMLCLQAGKHVLCEKPLTVNAQQAQKLYDYAKEQKLFLMEAVWTRFLPAIRALETTLQNGEIGEILSLNATFAISGEFTAKHRLKDPETAGGSLLDLGIYPITMSYIVFGQAPSTIQSFPAIGNTGVDERAYMLFEYEGNKHASLCCSFSHNLPTEAVIGGSKGFIRVPNFLGAKSFSVHKPDGTSQDHDYYYEDGDNFKFEIEEFHRCLEKAEIESDLIPAVESLSVMQTMDTLRKQWGLVYPDAIEKV